MAIRQPTDSSASFVEVEGELLEIDYRGHSAQVWDAQGKVTRFQYSEDQEDAVDALRRKRVIVRCRPAAPQAGDCELESIFTAIDDREFWNPLSLEELIERQGVKPIANPAEMLRASFWPEDEEEDFLEAVRAWRAES